MKAAPDMIAVRSNEGRLLFRMTADGRQIEVVHRRRRYTVALANVGVQPVVFVIAEVVEEETEKELT